MPATSKRIADLEGKLETVAPPRLTPSQQLAAERYAILLIKGRKIPKTLQRQIEKLPVEEVTPAIQQLIDEVMGVNGDGKNGNRLHRK